VWRKRAPCVLQNGFTYFPQLSEHGRGRSEIRAARTRAADRGYIQKGWLAYIDDAGEWTAAAGQWITITMRNNLGTASPHGDSTSHIPCEADYIHNGTARGYWFQTWQFLAKRYRRAENIAWFEPASEPHLLHSQPAPGSHKWASCSQPSEVIGAVHRPSFSY
jgi:hypothetical protein